MTEKYQHVPREMMAEEERQTRTVTALESIAGSLRLCVTYMTLIVDGVCTGSGPYADLYELEINSKGKVKNHATPKRKKAPSLASRNRKKRKG